MSAMSAVSQSSSVEAIRIVSLPYNMQTTYDVHSFAKDMLHLDASSVNIVNMQTEAGVNYRTAFVDIQQWDESEQANLYQSKLIEAGQWGISILTYDFPKPLLFDNGKPMSHLKITMAKKHSPSTEPLKLEDSEWSSIYIPVIPADLGMDNGDVRYNTEDSLAEFFEDHLKIGKVSRIDFMSKSVPGSDREVRCAYVHFEKWYDNHTTKLVRKTIASKGEFSCNGFYDGFEFRRFERSRFINFKVNHKPIPAATADMNVHQLAARVKLLEEQNAKLEERVSELENENDDLKYMVGNAQVSVDEYKRLYNEACNNIVEA